MGMSHIPRLMELRQGPCIIEDMVMLECNSQPWEPGNTAAVVAQDGQIPAAQR